MRWLRPTFLAALMGCASGLVPDAHSQTPTAVIVPNGYTQFTDANGKPLANGTVFFYTPGTTTAKTTWQDPYQNVANPNPVVLNGSGEALIWGSGIYRQVVYDVNNNLIWDQLTGGYNCVGGAGGGGVPMGANGALQYNNNGVFGGLPLGTSAQVLFGNASGPPTWGAIPAGGLDGLGTGVAAALALPLVGTGGLLAENGATLNGPAINNPVINGGDWTNPTLNGGVWNNPTFAGTITGLPGGGGACTDRAGDPVAHCVGSTAIFNLEEAPDPLPGGTGNSIAAYMTGQVAAWDVFLVAGLTASSSPQQIEAARLSAETEAAEAHKNVEAIPKMQDQIKQIADHLGLQLK